MLTSWDKSRLVRLTRSVNNRRAHIREMYAHEGFSIYVRNILQHQKRDILWIKELEAK